MSYCWANVTVLMHFMGLNSDTVGETWGLSWITDKLQGWNQGLQSGYWQHSPQASSELWQLQHSRGAT